MSVHVLQTLVLYECEKHAREEEWEEAHIGDRISGILMQLISCLQVNINENMSIYLNNCVCPVFRYVTLTHETCVHRREMQPGGCIESRV